MEGKEGMVHIYTEAWLHKTELGGCAYLIAI